MRLLVSVLILIDFYCLSLFFHGLFLPWPSFIKCCYTWLFYEDYFTISYLSCCNLLDKTSKYVKSNDSWMHFVKLINKKLYKPNSMLSFVQRTCNSSKKSIPAGSQFFTLLTKTPRQSKQIQFYSLWVIRSTVLGLINVTESLELQFIQTSCHLWRILFYKLKSAGS